MHEGASARIVFLVSDPVIDSIFITASLPPALFNEALSMGDDLLTPTGDTPLPPDKLVIDGAHDPNFVPVFIPRDVYNTALRLAGNDPREVTKFLILAINTMEDINDTLT